MAGRSWLYVLVGLVTLEGALLVHYHGRSGAAAILLTIACLIVGVGAVGNRRPAPEEASVDGWRIARGVVLLSGIAFVVESVGRAVEMELGNIAIVTGLAGLLVVFAYANTNSEGTHRRWITVGMIAVFLAIGTMHIEVGPVQPGLTDVFVFQDLGARYLLNGENPYTGFYPNIYSPEATQRFYGEGLADESGLKFGFPYSPLSLFLALPGHILTGDYRYSQLFAGAGVIALMSIGVNGPLGRVAGSLMALFPMHLRVFTGGWTEPFLLLLLGLVVWAVARRSKWVPYLFGVFLASKLSLAIIAPLYFLIDRPLFGKSGLGIRLGKVALGAVAVTLPLALWDFERFWFSVVELQFLQPFRVDALSLLVWFGNTFGIPHPIVVSILPFLVSALAIALVLRRGARTASGLAICVGFVFLVWLAFTKQSFLNHYYFAVGALLLGVAYAGRSKDAKLASNAMASTGFEASGT